MVSSIVNTNLFFISSKSKSPCRSQSSVVLIGTKQELYFDILK
nr:MAG TPA: hypothetical protein [Caudoviricetes sp.]